MFNAHRISLKSSEVEVVTVLNYALCREGVGRSGSVAPRTHPRHWSRYSDSTMGWTIRRSNLGRDKRFLSSPNRPDRPWSPTSCSVGTWALCRGWSGLSVKFTTYIPLKPKLRMRGAIPVLSLYAAVVRSGTAFMYVEICVTFTSRLLYPIDIDS
jgi:hypothetical protein